MKKRDKRYDVMKGLVIILMVVLHAQTNPSFGHVVALFHMPVFFIVAGWFFKEAAATDLKSLSKCVMGKVKRLWLPFAVWAGAFVLMHNLFVAINVYTDNAEVIASGCGGQLVRQGLFAYWSTTQIVDKFVRAILMLYSNGMGGAFWFLKCLFWASVFYCGVEWILHKMTRHAIWIQTVLAILFASIGKYCCPNILFYVGDGTMLSAYCLLHVGRLMRHFDLRIERLPPVWRFVVGVASLVALVALGQIGEVIMAANVYPSISFLLAVSVFGWFMIMAISDLIVSNFMQLAGVISYVGAHTMPIVLFHFLAFKVVSLIGLACVGGGYGYVAAFPVYFHGFFWNFAYTVCGIALPIALGAGYNYLVRKVNAND